MNDSYANDYGKVWVVGEDTYVLEKYFDTLDMLFRDQSKLCEEIHKMQFSIEDTTIYSTINTRYVKIKDNISFYEPRGPKNIWVIKFDLQYLGA